MLFITVSLSKESFASFKFKDASTISMSSKSTWSISGSRLKREQSRSLTLNDQEWAAKLEDAKFAPKFNWLASSANFTILQSSARYIRCKPIEQN